MFLYSIFCCDHCGQKSVKYECGGCRSAICLKNGCGTYVNCYCREPVLHCKSCKERYACEKCDDTLCKKCVLECITCHTDLCKLCFYYADHRCWDSSDSTSVPDEVIPKQKIQCVQCRDEISCDQDANDEEMFGQCPQCEYYNEIHNLKLCKNCIVTCQLCAQQLCVNCMNVYHEPCEQWRRCSCGSLLSLDDLPCESCGTEEFCLECQRVCKFCGKTVCRACEQRHLKHETFTTIPDDMLLLIFKLICSTKQMTRTESMLKLFALGLVNRLFRRVELKFWRQVVDENPFFTSKLKKSTRFKVSAGMIIYRILK